MQVSVDIAGRGAGTYPGTITVDAGAAGTQLIDVTLVISAGGDVAQLPFSETFETGALANYWAVTGTNNFRTQVTDQNGPHGGAYHLTMDASTNGTMSRNELTLTVNLTGASDVVLRFFAREWSDEAHTTSSPFTGGADFDGVAISEDGVTWYEVRSLTTLTDTYTEQVVYLDDHAAAHGLAYNGLFKVRFNQYDNYTMTSDGIGLDDITMVEEPQTPAAIPFVEDFETGSLASCWRVGGTASSRTQVTDANGPNGGSYHVTMDASVSNSFSRNEVTLMVDLVGASGVELRFFAREWGDEPHTTSSPFTMGADFDGVAISEDGMTWYEVHSFTSLTTTYVEQVVDLDAAAAANGLSYNGEFRIRFNQYDNYPMTSDGIGIDDVSVTGMR
ncbi:MAG: hypothetical protein ACYTAF_16090, partial [Planctomycetota bacterium]|jgi:hypothetical protein